uniref:Malectin domain-containing protein n=1 Tax=Eutreptiella gymnastica TaxID=73025 RepID=A0A7S1NSM4_9EUGL|mmetsp:Transcript_86287/g.150372  ORF Transcript_86287/g.150372 Transcript_86287/m.150372 type:complete len:263 (+) Transcript_86287:154-942(+)
MNTLVVVVVLTLFVVTSSAPIQVDIPNGQTVLYAINAGGNEYESDRDGITYETDSHFADTGSSKRLTSKEVIGNDAALYQTERFGSKISYSFPLEKKGYYTLVLKFAETVYSNPKAEIFQVSLNGKVVSSRLDIFRLVGASQAFDMSLTFFFTGDAIKISPQIQIQGPVDTITVELAAIKGSAKISALLLVKGAIPKGVTQSKPEKAQVKQPGVLELYGAYVGLLVLVVLLLTFVWNWYKSKSGPTKRQKLAHTVKRNVKNH